MMVTLKLTPPVFYTYLATCPLNETVATITVPERNASGAATEGVKCYYLVMTRMSSSEGRKYCAQRLANLAMLKNQEIMDALTTLARNNGPQKTFEYIVGIDCPSELFPEISVPL